MFFKKKIDNTNSLILAKNTFYNINDLDVNKKTTINGKVEYIKKARSITDFLIFSDDEEKIKNNIFIPNILNGLTNYVIIDNNDFIYKKTAAKMKELGYNVITFDLNDNFCSNYINPFDILEKNDIFLSYIFDNCETFLSEYKEKYADPFWHASEKNLLAFALFYNSIHNNDFSIDAIKYTIENMDTLMVGETNEKLILLYSTCKLHTSTLKSCYISLSIFLENYKNIFNYFKDEIVLKDYLNKKTIFYINFVDNINVKFATTFIKYLNISLNGNDENNPILFMYNRKDIHEEIIKLKRFSSTKTIALFNCCNDFNPDELDDYNLIIDKLFPCLTDYTNKYHSKTKIRSLTLTKSNDELIFLIKNPEIIVKKDKWNNFSYNDIPFISKQYNVLSRQILNDKAINYFYFKRIQKDENYDIYFFKRNKTSKIEVIILTEKNNELLIVKENKYDTYEELIRYYKQYEKEIEEIKYL